MILGEYDIFTNYLTIFLHVIRKVQCDRSIMVLTRLLLVILGDLQ